MEELVLKVEMNLDKNLIYYRNLLIQNGLELDLSYIAYDVYYTKNNLDDLTENQMKNSCIIKRKCLVLIKMANMICDFYSCK